MNRSLVMLGLGLMWIGVAFLSPEERYMDNLIMGQVWIAGSMIVSAIHHER